jgi:prepilin-type N-terminal cleavage/methylation domain-containing protein
MAYSSRHCRGFTLVEMLVAMAITLVMMAAVVTLFANVSNSVRNQRANLELMGQMRQVRNVLQQDLQGATCPGITWQRPESNHGYIELIEGPAREGNATNLIDEDPSGVGPRNPPSPLNPEIDHAMSTLPSSNLPFKSSSWATDGGGLGDFDDILMLTVRNEHEPFVGRVPADVVNARGLAQTFGRWRTSNVQSMLAEVVWFAIENPGYTDPSRALDPTVNGFFGEPGMRTIYRRTLLIAPWLNPYSRPGANTDAFTHDGQTFKAEPGLLRVLPKDILFEEAIAAIVAFQDRYDLSARLEWDSSTSRWKILANTLGDLTKRENRFYHYGFWWCPSKQFSVRRFPFPIVSRGSGIGSDIHVLFAVDPEVAKPSNDAHGTALSDNGNVAAFAIDAPANYSDTSRRYTVRPYAFLGQEFY